MNGSQVLSSNSNFSLVGANFSSIGSENGDGGTLILIPEMSFGCSGVISSWKGLVSASESSMFEALSLQVWRPAGDGSGGYDLVGSDFVMFDSSDFGEGTDNTTNQNKYYSSFDKEGISTSFQQGDIVGCFIPSSNSSLGPLEFVYKNSSSLEEATVDLVIFKDVRGKLCEVFSCNRAPTIVRSVIPLIRPQCNGNG